MKLQQILALCLERWKEISHLDFYLVDQENQIFTATDEHLPPPAEELDEFRSQEALAVWSGSCQIRKVFDRDELLYLLIIRGNQDPSPQIGELAVCQVESLITAYSRKNDRNQFFQDVLLGRYTNLEIYNLARKIRLTSDTTRAVFLVEIPPRQSANALTAIRSIFDVRNRDYASALDDTTIVIVQELRSAGTAAALKETAAMLVDTLNTEIMTRAKVSYSNPVTDLPQLSGAYKEARTAMEIGRIFYAEHNIFGYSQLGIGRLIYQLPPEICEMFLQEIFMEESLDSLDEETMNTIRTFFENDLNLSRTSQQLYVHRNTLGYRFEKIQRKYGLDLRSFEDAMTFKIAMMVTNYLKYKRGCEKSIA